MRDAFQRILSECQSTFVLQIVPTGFCQRVAADAASAVRVSIVHSGSNLRAYLMVFDQSNHPCRVKHAPRLARRGPYGVVRAFCTCTDHQSRASYIRTVSSSNKRERRKACRRGTYDRTTARVQRGTQDALSALRSDRLHASLAREKASERAQGRRLRKGLAIYHTSSSGNENLISSSFSNLSRPMYSV